MLFKSPVTVERGTGLYEGRWIVCNNGEIVPGTDFITEAAARECAKRVRRQVEQNRRNDRRDATPLDLSFVPRGH